MFLLPEGSFRDSPFYFSLLFCSISCCMVQMKLTWQATTWFCSVTTLSNCGLSFACDSAALPNKQHVPIILRSCLAVEIANALVYLLIGCILMFHCNYALLFPPVNQFIQFHFLKKRSGKEKQGKAKKHQLRRNGQQHIMKPCRQAKSWAVCNIRWPTASPI